MNSDILERFAELPEGIRDEYAKAVRRVADADLFFFAKYILAYKDLRHDTHDEAVRVLESDAHRKIVIMPRGTFKSTLASVAYPIWRLARDPDMTIMLDSEIYTNSKNFLREIRQHLESNDLLRMVWGPWKGPVWTEGEITIAQRRRNRKEASITVGGIETVKVGQHYDAIIGDDYNSPRNSDTPEKCSKVIDHVRYNLNILNPGGEYVFAATRYAERDVPGFFFKEILAMPHLAEGKLTAVNESGPLAIEREALLDFT